MRESSFLQNNYFNLSDRFGVENGFSKSSKDTFYAPSGTSLATYAPRKRNTGVTTGISVARNMRKFGFSLKPWPNFQLELSRAFCQFRSVLYDFSEQFYSHNCISKVQKYNRT